jgi:hypothetical protein
LILIPDLVSGLLTIFSCSGQNRVCASSENVRVLKEQRQEEEKQGVSQLRSAAAFARASNALLLSLRRTPETLDSIAVLERLTLAPNP